jgi:nitrogen fixation protein NifQ
VEAIDVYRWLMGVGKRGACEAFDAHVVASILSIALVEASGDDRAVVDAVGLDARSLADFVGGVFPDTAPVFGRIAAAGLEPTLSDDEACLRELLARHSTMGSPFEERLAAMVARRAQRPNHLWQDLGLRNRRELSWLMARHFEPLAARNRADMKWKKFLYRMICRDSGFLLCTSPTCGECVDFDDCFGDESGESLLASVRRVSGR